MKKDLPFGGRMNLTPLSMFHALRLVKGVEIWLVLSSLFIDMTCFSDLEVESIPLSSVQ